MNPPTVNEMAAAAASGVSPFIQAAVKKEEATEGTTRREVFHKGDLLRFFMVGILHAAAVAWPE